MIASEPCPCSVMLVWQTIEPAASRRTAAPVLRGDARAADPIEGRAGIGDFDERREPDAAMDSRRAQARLFLPQSGVVHHCEQAIERRVMRQRLELHPGRRVGRIGVVPDQIAAPNLDRIHPDRSRRAIDEPFRHRTGYGMTDRAILAHDIFVLEGDARAGAIVANRVGTADEVDDLVGLDRAGARIRPSRGRCRSGRRSRTPGSRRVFGPRCGLCIDDRGA